MAADLLYRSLFRIAGRAAPLTNSTIAGELPGAHEADFNKGPAILAAVCITTSIALLVTLARVYVRIVMVHRMGYDDYVMVAATGLSVIGWAVIIPEVLNGAGRHISHLEPGVATTGLKLNFATQPIYFWAPCLAKFSVGLFLLRITTKKSYARFIWGTMIFVVFYSAFSTITVLLQCKNLAILWDSSVQTTCWPQRTLQCFSYSQTGATILTDVIFATIPIPMLWGIQVTGRVKAYLIGIMGLSVFACAASVVKATYVVNYGKTGDFLWDSAELTIWITTETNVGIIAACLPCLKPLFKKIIGSPWIYASTSRAREVSIDISRGFSLITFSRSKAHGVEVTGHNTSNVGSGVNASMNGKLVREDNCSEESMFSLQGGHIKKTTVIKVNRYDIESRTGGEINFWNRRADLSL